MNKPFVATYRLQLNKDFTFQDAEKISDYLRDLNVSHLYLSPLLSSVPDSNHGYDTVDFTEISGQRGGQDGFDALARKICAYDYPLKMLVDIVPNHMGANVVNPYWRDVLEKGHASAYWTLFDLKLQNGEKIKLPVLLEDGKNQFELVEQEGRKCLRCNETVFPLNDEAQSAVGFSDDLLSNQHYELVLWTESFTSMSYRRFFDVTGLIGVRVEDEKIFKLIHEKIFALLKEYPCIEGVRIDHIDGLADPETYLERLSEFVQPVWIEKIVARGETVVPGWKTRGTTGYEFIDRLNQLLVEPQGFKKIENHWIENTSSPWKNFISCVFDSKIQVIDELFKPELNRLVRLVRLSGKDAQKAKLFWTGLICGLQIYRIYKESDPAKDEWIAEACHIATDRLGPAFAETIEIFLPLLSDPTIAKEWQQLSGPVMAKGLEDTAHYRYTPLTALNEVGCSPTLAQTDKNSFFVWLGERRDHWPDAMNTTSTHDTKRSEDTRHRLYALADRPERWLEFFETSARLNAALKPKSISPATEDFIYQSLLGTWPLDGKIDDDYTSRIKAYLKKANRERRIDTNWIGPDETYESAVDEFIDQLLQSADFKRAAQDFAGLISLDGAVNSLTAQTLKILSFGVPDIYQGSESWEFNLVDPDNRRAVDYALRQELLFVADNMDVEQGRNVLLDYLSLNWQDGTIKVWLTRTLLRIRQSYMHLFDRMEPLDVSGSHAENLIAYRIGNTSEGLLVLCPRYPGTMIKKDGLGFDWKDTSVTLPPGEITDLIGGKALISGSSVLADELFSSVPVAVFSVKI